VVFFAFARINVDVLSGAWVAKQDGATFIDEHVVDVMSSEGGCNLLRL